MRCHPALVNRQSTRNKWSRGMEKMEPSFFFIRGMQMAKSHSKKQWAASFQNWKQQPGDTKIFWGYIWRKPFFWMAHAPQRSMLCCLQEARHETYTCIYVDSEDWVCVCNGCYSVERQEWSLPVEATLLHCRRPLWSTYSQEDQLWDRIQHEYKWSTLSNSKLLPDLGHKLKSHRREVWASGVR